MLETESIIENLEITLDDTLKEVELKPISAVKFNKNLVTKGNIIVREVIEGDIRHNNFLEYLGAAWNSHRGIVIAPQFFWHIILCELATLIKNDPKRYRKLFTSSKDKVEIIVQTNDAELLPLESIIEQLKDLVPSDTNSFFPEFTTSTEQSIFAMRAAFADAMSPFYEYGMYMCGISKVKILGNERDWKLIVNHLSFLLRNIFRDNETIQTYFDRVIICTEDIIQSIEDRNAGFWKNIFRLERCGSGGQVEVKGWIQNFYLKRPRPGYINNYPTNVSYVKYKNLTTGKNFELVSGLFSSKEDNGYLTPEYGYLITEVPA